MTTDLDAQVTAAISGQPHMLWPVEIREGDVMMDGDGWLVVTAAAVALFVVFARYRFPLIPVLTVFAAAGIAEGIARLRREHLAGLIAPGIVLQPAVW